MIPDTCPINGTFAVGFKNDSSTRTYLQLYSDVPGNQPSNFVNISLDTSFQEDKEMFYLPVHVKYGRDLNSDNSVDYFYTIAKAYYNQDSKLALSISKYDSRGTLLVDGLRCANPINQCLVYSLVDGLCETCSSSTKLSPQRTNCLENINMIEGCDIESADRSMCIKCADQKVLSIGKKKCGIPMDGCNAYSDNDFKCLICRDDFLNSDGKCIKVIINCVAYQTNGSCNSCISGTRLTSNPISCEEENGSSITLKSKISTKTNSTGSNANAFYCTKGSTYSITHHYDALNYILSVFNDTCTFSSISQKNIQTNDFHSSISADGSLTISFNLPSSMASGYYFLNLGLKFNKIKGRMLGGSDDQQIPDNFVLNYQEKRFYIGSSSEVSAALNENDYSHTEDSSSDSSSKLGIILAIVFSVLGVSLIIVVIGCIVWRRKKAKNAKPLEQTQTAVNFEISTPSINPIEENILKN